MIWVVLIAIFVIALIAEGLGIGFFSMLLILGGIAIFVCLLIGWTTSTEKDTAEKAERKKKIQKIGLIVIGVAVVIGLIVSIGGCVGNLDLGSSSDSEYDDMMAGYDYGDGYYYDSGDNAVKKTLW